MALVTGLARFSPREREAIRAFSALRGRGEGSSVGETPAVSPEFRRGALDALGAVSPFRRVSPMLLERVRLLRGARGVAEETGRPLVGVPSYGFPHSGVAVRTGGDPQVAAPGSGASVNPAPGRPPSFFPGASTPVSSFNDPILGVLAGAQRTFAAQPENVPPWLRYLF